jgi:hypothetical protein
MFPGANLTRRFTYLASLSIVVFFVFSSMANELSLSTSPPQKPNPATPSAPVLLQAPSTSFVVSQSSEISKQQGTQDSKIPLLSKEQAETLDKTSNQGNDIPFIGKSSGEKFDKLQEQGSTLVLSAAEWIDSFFDDPRYLQEENRTRAKLKLGLGYTRLDEFELVSSIDIRINLPRFEDRANFFINANDDSDFDADSSPISNTVGGQKNDNEQLSAGFQYFLAMGEKYNVSTELGASTSYLYTGLRYRYLHPFFDGSWEGRFTNRLRYYTDDGWENKASYDIETYFDKRFLFRTTLTGVLSEANDGFPFSAVIRLYQVLNIDSAILYDIGGYFDTEPELDMTDLQFKIRYRQRFYRDWLVLEVAPLVTFPLEYDREANPGLFVKFEFDFGYLKDREAYQNIFSF